MLIFSGSEHIVFEDIFSFMAFQNSGNSGGYSQGVLGVAGIEMMVIDVISQD